MNDGKEKSHLKSPAEAPGHFCLIESSNVDLGGEEGAVRRGPGGPEKPLLILHSLTSGDANHETGTMATAIKCSTVLKHLR